jgi:ribonuclease HI
MAPPKSKSEQTLDVIIYTDGACSGNPGPGGWAAILRHPATGTTKRLSGGEPRTTNNQMELRAAIEGLRSLKVRRESDPLRVHLVSDSEYLIRGLTEWMDNWIRNDWRRGKKPDSEPVKNVELWKSLYALSRPHQMSYEHVRGHAGHPENEECDRMAVAAIKSMRAEMD